MEFKKDWKHLKLSDLGEIVGGGTPSTKNELYYGGEIAWITPKDLSGYTSKYISKGERNITEEGLFNSSAKLMPEGTVLFSSRAPIGYIAIASNPVSTNQGFKSIVPNETTSSDFLYYLLKYKVDEIKNLGSGSTFSEVSGKVMKNIDVYVPDIKIQERISNILNAYDKKIENNNKIIANLETQAQALFKYYFVDFEPFKDGKFIDSDLGLIPDGWEIVELSDVADFRNGYSFKSKELEDRKTESNQYKVFKMGDISVGGGFNLGKTRSWVSKEYVEEKNISRYIIDYGDLLMCMTDMKDNVRLLGHVAFNWFEDEYILNQRVGRISSESKEITNEYLYFLINSDKFIQELRGRANRGVQVNLSTKEIKASKLLVPNTPYLDKYNKFISKIMKYNGYLTKQNQTLAQTRDALLPKLMAGEIDLEDLGGFYD